MTTPAATRRPAPAAGSRCREDADLTWIVQLVAGLGRDHAHDGLGSSSNWRPRPRLEAYTINDRQGCLKTLRTVRQRINNARTALKVGKADGKNAASHLSSASEGLDGALHKDCAPAIP